MTSASALKVQGRCVRYVIAANTLVILLKSILLLQIVHLDVIIVAKRLVVGESAFRCDDCCKASCCCGECI